MIWNEAPYLNHSDDELRRANFQHRAHESIYEDVRSLCTLKAQQNLWNFSIELGGQPWEFAWFSLKCPSRFVNQREIESHFPGWSSSCHLFWFFQEYTQGPCPLGQLIMVDRSTGQGICSCDSSLVWFYFIDFDCILCVILERPRNGSKSEILLEQDSFDKE